MPIVSIIVPIYNVEKYLRQCLDSVLAQTFSDWEMILVDDGSTDGSGKIADEYKTLDGKIRVIHQMNAGLSGARNTGLAVAKGKYIYFLDSDDYIDDILLEKTIECMESSNAEMLAFNFRFDDKKSGCQTTEIKQGEIIIDSEESLLEYYAKTYMGWSISYCVWNKLYKRNIIESNNLRFEDTKEIFAEDICFNMYYGMYVKKVLLMSDVLMSYRIRQDSIMGKSDSINKIDKLTNLGYKVYWHLKKSGCPQLVIEKFSIIFLNMLVSHYAKVPLKSIKSTLRTVQNQDFLKRMHKEYILNFMYAAKLLGLVRAIDCLQHALHFLLLQNKKQVCYVKFRGGLGNQMFQYAFCKRLEACGCKVYADLSYYNYDGVMPFKLNLAFEDSLLKVRFRKKSIITDGVKKLIYMGICHNEESADSQYEKNLLNNISGGLYIGYWQTEKYFKNIDDKIRNDFQFKYGEEKLRKLSDEIKSKQSVSVHIRRGDYLKAEDIYGGICTKQYYDNAIEKISENVDSPEFYFFSDDIEWVKENYMAPNYHYISSNMFDVYEDWYDLCLMSRCRHNIIANSSFSWWGAWLNENDKKMVIAPKIWCNGEETPDIWCDGWIRL